MGVRLWADNHSDMYVRVLQDELTFPEDRAMDQDTKSLIRGVSSLLISVLLRLGTHHALFLTATATQPRIEVERASHQEASLFLDDVRCSILGPPSHFTDFVALQRLDSCIS